MYREDGADGDIEVKYRTIDKTAFDGKDFTGGEGTIFFKSGETTKDIKIPIIDDMSASGTEEFFEVELFELSNEGCKFGSIPRTTVTIANVIFLILTLVAVWQARGEQLAQWGVL